MTKGLVVALLLCSSCFAADLTQTRVFISDRDGWEASGGFVANQDSAAGSMKAGIRRQNTEQVKTFNHECPTVTITSSPDKADFVVIWDTKTWGQTSWSGHQNEFTVYSKTGDLVKSGAAHKQTNAARDICKAVTKGKT